MKWPGHLLTAAALTACLACQQAPQPDPAAERLAALLAAPAPDTPRPLTRDLAAFYEQRANAPAWVTSKGKVPHAEEILSTLARAADHGLPGDYGHTDVESAIAAIGAIKDDEAARTAAVAELDVRITAALLALGRDVALGHSSPTAIDKRWKARRTAPDFASTLAAHVDGDLAAWLDTVKPVHLEYAQLQTALQALEGQQMKGGWPAVPAKSLAPGQHNPAVIAMRKRLAAGGYLSGSAASSDSAAYDADVAAAVKALQEHHTLKVTGIADAATLAAMNVPIETRIAQVRANLERWRWMPDDLGARHFFVNIPSYHVLAREDGKTALDIRVVVGKPGHETPVFSSEMDTVVFSPYWNIPDTIAEGETVPALAKDPKYLERNHIEILRPGKHGAEAIDPSSIDWDDEGATKGLLFRQLPGADNALGHVKFLFPNPFDVYLHDTPADALFSRTGRAFSHGCVRVEEPERLAQYVLRDAPEWTPERILEAMHSGTEKGVKLREKIPVHIAYFTTSVDANGGLHLYDDVYGYDRKQLATKLTR